MARHQDQFTISRDKLLEAVRAVYGGKRMSPLDSLLHSFGAERISDLNNENLFGLIVSYGQMASMPDELTSPTPNRTRPEHML